MAANGSLVEIGGRAARIEDVEGQYMGLLRIDPVGWATIRGVLDQCSERERAAMQMTGLLQRVVAAGACNVAAISYDGEWGEIDSPSDLAAYPDFTATAEARRS
jgi:choline kinase